MESTQKEYKRGPESGFPANWEKESLKEKPSRFEGEKKIVVKEQEKKPWNLEAGRKQIEEFKNRVKEAQDTNSLDLPKWQKQLDLTLKQELKHCASEYSNNLTEVANYIQTLENVGATFLGEDMDAVYERLNITEIIKGIKKEAVSKKEAKRIEEKYTKIAAGRSKEKILAGGDLMTDQPVKAVTVGKTSFWNRLKTKLFGTVEDEQKRKEEEAESYALKLEEKAAARETKKGAGEATKRLEAAYKETEFEEKVDKEMEMVTRVEEKRQEKAAEKKVNKMMKTRLAENEPARMQEVFNARIAKMDQEGNARAKKIQERAEWAEAKKNVGKGFDQESYLEVTKGKSRVQKIIEQQKFEMPAQAADYLKGYGLPDSLIDTTTSRLKELRQSAKGRGMNEIDLDKASQNFLTGITQKYRENPRLFSKKPTSYETRKMEEIVNQVGKETMEKAA